MLDSTLAQILSYLYEVQVSRDRLAQRVAELESQLPKAEAPATEQGR